MKITQQLEHISKENYTRILDAVFTSLKEKGFKATTMDSIASQLSMSKRTLYEIFENKEHMLDETIKHSRRQLRIKITRVFTQSSTVIEALIKILSLHLIQMKQTKPVFFKDMDAYAGKWREMYDAENSEDMEEVMMGIINLGIQQDVFREDIEYRIIIRFIHISTVSLKRSEEFFPKDISLSDIYTTLCVTFLRSIATPKGLALIDEYLKTEQIIPTNENETKITS